MHRLGGGEHHWKELPKKDEFYLFVFHFVPFENHSKVLRKERKKMREDGREWWMFCLLGLGCCGSFASCLNSWHFYPEWRWNFPAKEHIRAQISSYFQKHVVCTGSEISKLKNCILATYSVLFTFLFSIQSQYTSAGFPVAVIHVHLSHGSCVFISSPVLLPPLSPSYLCPSLTHCLPSAPICVWRFPEQKKLWYETVQGQRNPEQLRTPSPSPCLPCSSRSRCPHPERCTYHSVSISGPFPPTVCSC